MQRKTKKQTTLIRELKQQEQEIQQHIKTPGFKHTLPSHQDDAQKKLTQIKEAEKNKGELNATISHQ